MVHMENEVIAPVAHGLFDNSQALQADDEFEHPILRTWPMSVRQYSQALEHCRGNHIPAGVIMRQP